MKGFQFCLLLTVLLTVSCTEKAVFPVQATLVGTPMNLKDSLNQTTRIYGADGKLLLVDFDGTDYLLMYDTATGRVNRFLENGDSPEQVLSVQSARISNGQIHIFDTGNQCLKSYDWTDGHFVSSSKRLEQYALLYAQPLQDSLYLGCPYQDSVRVVLFNGKGEVIDVNGQFPFAKTFPASYAHAFATMSDIAVHPTERKVAMAAQYASALQIFQYDDKGIQLLVENDIEAPEYDQNQGAFGVNERTKWGYVCLTCDAQYIYLLYSGAIQKEVNNPCIGNVIHVFNWQGDPVAELKVGEMLSKICVMGHRMYAICVSENADYEIFEYDLPRL